MIYGPRFTVSGHKRWLVDIRGCGTCSVEQVSQVRGCLSQVVTGVVTGLKSLRVSGNKGCSVCHSCHR